MEASLQAQIEASSKKMEASLQNLEPNLEAKMEQNFGIKDASLKGGAGR